MFNFGGIELKDVRLGSTQPKSVYFSGYLVWGGAEPGPTPVVAAPLCFTAPEGGATL